MISQQELKDLLHYSPETGVFLWKKDRGKLKSGDQAGCLNKVSGYVVIRVLGKIYQAHRLAWLFITGSFPVDQTDHINHIKNDNRFCNLREANASENGQNRGMQKNNTSGVKGVVFFQNRYVVHARLKGKQHYLGRYKTEGEASDVYKEFIRKHHGEYRFAETKEGEG